MYHIHKYAHPQLTWIIYEILPQTVQTMGSAPVNGVPTCRDAAKVCRLIRGVLSDMQRRLCWKSRIGRIGRPTARPAWQLSPFPSFQGLPGMPKYRHNEHLPQRGSASNRTMLDITPPHKLHVRGRTSLNHSGLSALCVIPGGAWNEYQKSYQSVYQLAWRSENGN